MVSAGVNLPEAIAVSTDSLRNRVFMRRLNGVTEQMLEGQGLAGPLARTRLFPGTATSMLRVGEDTGSMDTQTRGHRGVLRGRVWTTRSPSRPHSSSRS
nr:type II secretion system F family protein [Nocardioides convexus]